MVDENLDDLGFRFDRRNCGERTILRRGSKAVVLRGIAAQEFLTSAESLSPADLQQLMARLTGNYKRGNERTARSHPRNRR